MRQLVLGVTAPRSVKNGLIKPYKGNPHGLPLSLLIKYLLKCPINIVYTVALFYQEKQF